MAPSPQKEWRGEHVFFSDETCFSLWNSFFFFDETCCWWNCISEMKLPFFLMNFFSVFLWNGFFFLVDETVSFFGGWNCFSFWWMKTSLFGGWKTFLLVDENFSFGGWNFFWEMKLFFWWTKLFFFWAKLFFFGRNCFFSEVFFFSESVLDWWKLFLIGMRLFLWNLFYETVFFFFKWNCFFCWDETVFWMKLFFLWMKLIFLNETVFCDETFFYTFFFGGMKLLFWMKLFSLWMKLFSMKLFFGMNLFSFLKKLFFWMKLVVDETVFLGWIFFVDETGFVVADETVFGGWKLFLVGLKLFLVGLKLFLGGFKLFFFGRGETSFGEVETFLGGGRGWNFLFGMKLFLGWNYCLGMKLLFWMKHVWKCTYFLLQRKATSRQPLSWNTPLRSCRFCRASSWGGVYLSVAAVSFAAPAPLQYAAPVRHAAPTITETGIDLHQTASQMYSQRPQAGYAAPAQYGAPIQYGGPVIYVPALRSTMTVTKMNMIWTALRMSYNSPMLATELQCSPMLPYNWNNHQLRGTFFNMTVTGVDINRHGIPTFCSNRRLELHLKVFAATVQECQIQPSQPTPGIQLRREPSILAG